MIMVESPARSVHESHCIIPGSESKFEVAVALGPDGSICIAGCIWEVEISSARSWMGNHLGRKARVCLPGVLRMGFRYIHRLIRSANEARYFDQLSLLHGHNEIIDCRL